ncbi:MAG: NAD(P)H-hydrate dehydratase [Bacteroidia bacterium]|nr:NAD(P)H-hydrate dehydratase [Bacteroidia bacterium]
MLPVYTSEKIKEWDKYTIENEPISSVDLMERAANACTEWIINHISPEYKIIIICGDGNNGGDGLAIGRLLLHYKYIIEILISNSEKRSSDNYTNLKRIENYNPSLIKVINEESFFKFNQNSVIIDCIFGVGFKPPVDNFWKGVINSINDTGCKIISIDLPSGLPAEPENENEQNIVKAWHTLTFQVPKISLLMPGWGDFTENFTVININLNSDFILQNPTKLNYFTIEDAKKIFIRRNRFSHKGNYGHALLIAGNEGKCGAAIMSSRACIKSGAGLVSCFSNNCCDASIVNSSPEVMTEKEIFDFDKYSAIGLGCGIGTDKNAVELVEKIIKSAKIPLVIDADAIKIVFENNFIKHTSNVIITPHPKEFDNIAGQFENSYERFKKASQLAIEMKIIIVLKGANTAIFLPEGSVYFNSTGNPGMATAGSGDVLTGVITSFVSQGYSLTNAAMLGVFIHGMSGDMAAGYNSITGLSATDIIDFLNPVFKELENYY